MNVFDLTGFDKRLTAARPDLAAEKYRSKITADRYVQGRLARVRDGALPLRRAPAPDAPLDSEALHGETVIVYEEEEGFAWAELSRDLYVGYLPAIGLEPLGPAPTHRVSALRTFVYPGASIKAPPLMALSTGAQVAVTAMRDTFAVTPGGFIYAAHLSPLAIHAADFVSVAETFLHVPYLWGGKTSLGLDCSGLLQVALEAAGINAPRDSDMIEAAMGQRLAFDESLADLRRGDLIFWRGHCGVMRDAGTLLHANGHHMMVVSEPLKEARDRILAGSYGPVTSVKRL